MQAIFGAVPGPMTFLSGGYANREEAMAAINRGEHGTHEEFEYLAILPAHMILIEDLPKPKRDYATALEILDLRPSELEALAKAVAETSADEDHRIIDAIKHAYTKLVGDDMVDPYP